MNLLMIYPMCAMVAITFIVGAFAFLIRVTSVRSGKIDPRYFKNFSFGEPTEMVLKTSRHFANIFEVPVIFYPACIVAMILPISGFWILFWAWMFVAARAGHAYIHIGPNKIYPRMATFFLGFFAVLAMWVLIICEVSSR